MKTEQFLRDQYCKEKGYGAFNPTVLSEYALWLEKNLLLADKIEQYVWIDAEKNRPPAGSKIITLSAVGMYQGTYHAIGSGVVYVDNDPDDAIVWEDVYEWVFYPKTE